MSIPQLSFNNLANIKYPVAMTGYFMAGAARIELTT